MQGCCPGHKSPLPASPRSLFPLKPPPLFNPRLQEYSPSKNSLLAQYFVISLPISSSFKYKEAPLLLHVMPSAYCMRQLSRLPPPAPFPQLNYLSRKFKGPRDGSISLSGLFRGVSRSIAPRPISLPFPRGFARQKGRICPTHKQSRAHTPGGGAFPVY